MAKKRLKAFMPNQEAIQSSRWLRLFGRALTEPNLWHLHRRSVATAFSIGLFVAFIPAPGHMILAGLISILLRANLPIAVALVWIVNPLTMIPLFGFAYSIGAFLLGVPLSDLHFEWAALRYIWTPLLLGCFICGTVLSIAGNVGIRFYWRYSVAKAWKNRALQRALKETLVKPLES